MLRKKKTRPASADGGADPAQAVEDWRRLNTATDDLHEVDDSTLTTDPAANPRTLAQRIAVADTVSRAVLAEQAEQAEDRLSQARRRRRSRAQRGERALTVAETRADRAAATLEAIDTYEEADNPAASALALHQADPRIRRMLIGVSLAGSAASALGIGAWAHTSWELPVAVLVGVLAEALLTVPVILLLTFQGLVRTHNKADLAALGSDARRVLALMLGAIALLLVVSVGLNTTGIIAGGTGLLGLVGITGAVIALGASAASWGATTVIRAVIRANTDQWRTDQWAAERRRLEETAAGAFIPAVDESGPAPSSTEAEAGEVDRMRRVLAALAEEHVAVLAERGTDALQALLDHTPPTGGAPAAHSVRVPPTPGGHSAHGAQAHPDDGADTGAGAHGPAHRAEAPPTAQDQGLYPELEGPRRAVMLYIAAHGRAVATRQIVRDTALPRSTVRDHRQALAESGYAVFAED
ncbi:helix-turn-helix domain-containing protein [Nocardiopsis sp. LOL_012]|uniref:helix-turn-helix domain-containing protein n=1 Tax=Nocardiopsis sp. LOL_012 TaxID=3345409 RepID=UPI003A8BE700